MGPQRHNWSFPHSGEEVVAAIEAKIASFAKEMDESITTEAAYEQRLAQFRERLREAGVTEWAGARLDPADPDVWGSYGRTSNPEAAFRDRQKKVSKQIMELRKWLIALKHDIKRDPNRTFRLTADDLEFFGITDPINLA